METAAHSLLDRAGALPGRPTEAAFACAMVEHAATAFQDGLHIDGFHVTRLLRDGRTALRAELGLDPAATPQSALDAMIAAAAAFRRGDPGAAAAALAPVACAGRDPARHLAALAPPEPLRRALLAARRMFAQGGGH